eukprot:495279-Prorocentrum_lima.AAC.1
MRVGPAAAGGRERARRVPTSSAREGATISTSTTSTGGSAGGVGTARPASGQSRTCLLYTSPSPRDSTSS